MIVKAYYAGGRIDVFDTDHLVDAVPQPGNLLANYTLDFSDLAGDSLWLRSYYHEAADAMGAPWSVVEAISAQVQAEDSEDPRF